MTRRRTIRKWSFVRPRPSPWLIAAESLLLAVLAHAMLLPLVNKKPPYTAQNAENHAGISLISAGTLGEERFAEFSRWLRRHDPADFANTFSELDRIIRLLPQPGPREAAWQRAAALPQMTPPALRQFKELPQAPPLPEPAPPVTFPAGKLPELTPRILDAGGRCIAIDPGQAVPDASVTGFTLLRVRRNGELIRVETVESCGNSELDRLAATALLRHPERVPEGWITVEWPPPGEIRQKETTDQIIRSTVPAPAAKPAAKPANRKGGRSS